MLEVRHLRKTYRTKKGAVTKALDDVSLTFAETGMVFILGKSGSGKSTLLNVCGGLDRMDSGEIIIKGKSSNDFSGQDFDSYRNTYVGFVFQEYNILDEFTVEENIALALELQNKKRDKQAIEKILADVDMTSFASRKPNTLSGGQKQRVAIARALVKEPEIIMADEPTGALDSKTGQQVFDTLKKLSATKLVLVVSHDREFAEQYGDRIIELKDGKIISDQTRAESGEGSNNVRFFGSNTVSVQNGAELTDDDMKNIREFLVRSGGAAVISTSREHITEMKRDLPEMSIGAFEDVKEQPQSKSYPQQKLIRSHLPVRHAVRMGAGSLKTKPVRLVFTIILSVIAFILFGLASTLMLFDGKAVTKESLTNSEDGMIILSKAYYENNKSYHNGEFDYEYENKIATNYTMDEYKEIARQYPGALAAINADFYISNVSMPSTVQQFYSSNINGFLLKNDTLNYVNGRAPEAIDEVAISEYILSGLMADKTELKMYSETQDKIVEVDPHSVNDILYSDNNKMLITVDDSAFKIVGVYSGMTVPEMYSGLKEAADRGNQFNGDWSLSWQWQMSRENGLYNWVVATDELVDKYLESRGESNNNIDLSNYFDWSYSGTVIGYRESDDNVSGQWFYQMSKYEPRGDRQALDLYDYSGNKLTKLEAGSAAVDYSTWANIVSSSARKKLEWNDPADEQEKALREKYQEKISALNQAAEDEFRKKHPEPQWNDYAELEDGNDRYNDDWNKWNEARWEALRGINPLDALAEISWDNKVTVAQAKAKIKAGGEFLKELGVEITVIGKCEYNGEIREFKLPGIFYDKSNSSAVYLSDDLYSVLFVKSPYNDEWTTVTETKYKEPENAFVSKIFIANTAENVDKLVDFTYTRGDDDSSAMIQNSVMSQLEMVIDMADTMELGFLIAGLVLAVFAFLLMFNFISISITAKKKEIGILRAIGARTLDVFKIFLSEALIIVAICFALSTAGTFALCIVLNTMITADTIIKVSLFVFGPLSVLMILGIALLTSLVSTVIPVALYSRKPPIASIRAL